jgi:hypothetical protein
MQRGWEISNYVDFACSRRNAGHRAILLFARKFQPAAPFVLHNHYTLRVDAPYATSLHSTFQILTFISILVALITCDLGVTLEITGGVSATALAFIFPAACYLKLTDPGVPLYSRAKLPAVACLIFGVMVMSGSLFLALGKAWTVEGEVRICA